MPKYLYICSAGHSGSTLLDLLLGSHPRIASLGEIYQLPKNLALNTPCTCGQPVRDCSVWSAVTEILDQRLGIDINADPYSLDLGYIAAKVVVDQAHQTRLYDFKRRLMSGLQYLALRSGRSALRPILRGLTRASENCFVLYDAVREVQGVDLTVDSSKHYLKAASLYSLNPSDVRIIMLTRDGRGVYYSQRKRGVSRPESLSSWLNHYQRALPLLKQYIRLEHMLTIKYEDLVTDPSTTLRKVCDLAELEYNTAMLDFGSKVHHIANGNNMRFSTDRSLQLDTAWRENLSATDNRYFAVRAGATNRALGYPE